MKTELKVEINLMGLSSREANLLTRGMALLKEDVTEWDLGEEDIVCNLMDNLLRLENELINVGEF